MVAAYEVQIRVRPIDRFPREQTVDRVHHQFKSGSRYEGDSFTYGRDVPYSDTEELLKKEVAALGAHEVVIQIDVPDSAMRVDGSLRANAVPRSPAVVVTVVAPGKGPMSFPSDRFTKWQANVRAVAKTLEALRLVDRYGTTPANEQYLGFTAIGSGTPMGSKPMDEPWTPDSAARVVVGWISGTHDLAANARMAVEDGDYRRYAFRQAMKALHPDTADSDPHGVDRNARIARLTSAKDYLDGLEGAS